MIWAIQNRTFRFDKSGWVMGVLNVTPDSFSDGGKFVNHATALDHARRMIAEGADIIDIGGESSRPGAIEVSEDVELERVLPVIAALRRESGVLISIDTCKPVVARAAIAAGANIINDISGLRAEEMLDAVAELKVGAICMHMLGKPFDMQRAPVYREVVADVCEFFAERLAACRARRISDEQIVFDPGIGFGKTVEHNLSLLRNLPLLRTANRPMIIGVSRKSFIGKIIGSDRPEDRFWPTVALTAWCRAAGAEIFRVHDVLANVHSLRMTEAIHG